MVTDMDINDFRAWYTVILLACFVAVVIWAYAKRSKSRFDQAANLPFEDDANETATLDEINNEKGDRR